MKQLDLKPVGLTDRMEHNATAANFAQIEDAFNSNAITAEGMYAELNGKLATEANTRYGEDVNLQSQIDAIIQRLDTNEKNIADLQTRMKTAEDHIKKLDDIIFGMEYIDDTDEFMLDNSTPNPSEVEINDDVAVDDDNAEVVKELPHEVISNEIS